MMGWRSWPFLLGACVPPVAPTVDTLPLISCPPHPWDEDVGQCEWDNYPGTAFMGYPFVGGSNARRCAVASPIEQGCDIAFPWFDGGCPTDDPDRMQAAGWRQMPEPEQHDGRWYQRYIQIVDVYDPGPDHVEIVYVWTTMFDVSTGDIALIDIENEGPSTAFCCGDEGTVGHLVWGDLSLMVCGNA